VAENLPTETAPDAAFSPEELKLLLDLTTAAARNLRETPVKPAHWKEFQVVMDRTDAMVAKLVRLVGAANGQ
jgi:hypothetical protein